MIVEPRVSTWLIEGQQVVPQLSSQKQAQSTDWSTFASAQQSSSSGPVARNCMDPPCSRLCPLRHAALFHHRPASRPMAPSHTHSVPSMQFQVLLTGLSACFSTFLRSTFPLSVFMSYLDLGEIYLLLSAEITINGTLKKVKICEPPAPTRGFHPLCRSFPTDLQRVWPHLTTSSKGASVQQLFCRSTLFL